jgi:aminomethyltransferase
VEELDRALFAVQGPAAAEVLAHFAPGSETMPFMSAAPFVVDGCHLAVTRSGYTGEDGFEISVPVAEAERIARMLLAPDAVEPAGLGARDSLRLEAGLCLYGHDIDESTTPVEAGLTWTIGRRRREDGGFPGADIIRRQLADGPSRRLVGIRPEGRALARDGAEIRNAGGTRIGTVTSGGFGATVGGPVAMGYVASTAASAGTDVTVMIRDRPVAARVQALPFVPHRYYRP